MESYNFGQHYDPSVSGYIENIDVKSGYDNQPDSFAYEWHVLLEGGDTAQANYFCADATTSVVGNLVKHRIVTGNLYVGLLDGSVTEVVQPAYFKLRVVKDRVNSTVTAEVDKGDGNGPQQVPLSDADGFVQYPTYMLTRGSFAKFALFKIEQDFGSGYQEYARYDPNLVPANAGGFVPRGDADAVADSDVRIYNTLDAADYYTMETPSASAFTSVYDIADVNGGTIELGETGVEVTMSNEITPTDLYFTDGNKEYRPTYSQSGATFTFDVPLTSDDTIPDFGTLELFIVDADGTYSKSFEFVPPAGYTLVTLENPVELDESSYTYGTGLNPIAGGYYFHQPTTDFSIDINNVWSPVSDAPWSHTVWYLSSAGLRETTASDGHVVVNPAPSVNITTVPQTVTTGDAIPLSADVTDADSVLWSANLGGTFENDAQASTTFTPSEAGSLELTLTGTNAEGSASDSVLMTVEEPQVIPTAAITSAPTTANTGEQYNIEATITDADSVLWTCTSGQSPTFGDPNAASTTIILNEDGEHTIEITATSITGDTASDSFTVTSSTVVVESVLNLTVAGIGSGSRAVVLHDRTSRAVVFEGSMTFTDDAGSLTLTDVEVGTEIYGGYFGTNPPDTGTGLFGVTE